MERKCLFTGRAGPGWTPDVCLFIHLCGSSAFLPFLWPAPSFTRMCMWLTVYGSSPPPAGTGFGFGFVRSFARLLVFALKFQIEAVFLLH